MIFILFGAVQIAFAANRTADRTGNWNVAGTWKENAVPVAGDNVTIDKGITVTVNVSTAVCASLKLNDGRGGTATLQFNSGSQLTVYGNVTIGDAGGATRLGSLIMTAGGTLICNGFVANYGSFTPGTGTVIMDATNTLPSSMFGAFNNLTIRTGITTVSSVLTVNGTLSTNAAATLNMNTFVLSVVGTADNSGTLRTQNTSSDPIPPAMTWGGTVEYYGASAQTLEEGTYYNLNITNSAGVSPITDITVNGLLSLTTNPSSIVACISMGTYTLNMGASATTTGAGDVSGIVKRSTINSDVAYSFGNQYTTISFPAIGTLPSDMSVKIDISAAPSWMGTAVNRSYDIIRTGGSGARATITLHYLDGELNGNTESSLRLWDYHVTTPPALLEEHGRSNYNTTNNWISLSNISSSYFATTFDDKYWGFANTVATVHTWAGTTSSDWSDGTNWSGGLPDNTMDAVIPDAASTLNDPALTGDVSVNSLSIESGGILDASSYTLTLAGGMGAWINEGTFIPGTGTLTFTNASATMAGITDVNNLTIDASAVLTLSTDNVLNISGTLTNNGSLRASFLANTVVFTGTGQTIMNPNGGSGGFYSLSFSGTGTSAAGEGLTMHGTLNIGSGCTFDAASYSHVVKGDMLNNGTFTASTSSFTLDGSLLQTIGGTNSLLFNNLTLNNSAGFTLSNNVDIDGVLTFMNGILTTSSNVLKLNATASFSGASATSYISGILSTVYSSTGSKVFPIGKGGNYRPLTFNYTGLTGSSTVTAEQFESTMSGTMPPRVTLYGSRYWTISQTGGTDLVYDITLNGTGFSPLATGRIVKNDAGTINVLSASYSAPDYTSTGLTTLSDFALADECSTPATPVISGDAAMVFPQGGSVNISSTLADSYLWSNGETTRSLFVDTGGVFTVTVTIAGCSATSVSDTVVVIRNIKLHPGSCGLTLSSVYQVIYSNEVIKATDYKYKFIDKSDLSAIEYTRSDGQNYLQIVSVPGLKLGHSYDVLVKARLLDVWGNYSDTCTITMPGIPLTKLYPTSCGSTVPSLAAVIYCNPVSGAGNYKYKFVDVADYTFIEQARGNANNYLSLTQVSGLKLGHSYKVVVKAYMYSVWGEYGDTCVLNMPAVTKTKLYPSSCGSTVSSMAAVIYCNPVSGASNYKYNFVDVADYSSIEQARGNGNNYLALTQVTGLKVAHAYKVVVKAYLNNVWGDYGDTCMLYMPPVPTTQLYSSSCNKTVADLNAVIYIDRVSGATNYRYLFTDHADASTVEYTRGMNLNYLFLNLPSNLKMNHTYDVQVKAYLNNVWGSYGLICTLAIGGSPRLSGNNVINGINNSENQGTVSLYPNPFMNSFSLVINGENAVVKIYNVLGKVCQKYTFNAQGIYNLGEELQQGVYMIEVNSMNVTQYIKVVKNQ